MQQNCKNHKKYNSQRGISPIPRGKKAIMGCEFWGKGYFVNTVGQHGTPKRIAEYVRTQGVEKEYEKLKTNHQLELF